jgi:transposase
MFLGLCAGICGAGRICSLRVNSEFADGSRVHQDSRLARGAGSMASARQVGRQFGLAASTVRAMDLRYLERWNGSRRKPALRQMRVDEIYLGKKQKFLSVVCNLETREPLWFAQERKKESLAGFFQTELGARPRRGIQAAWVDLWEPYRLSIEQWAPHCQIIYDKFHIRQHANAAVDEVRRSEFFRKGGRTRGVVQGKRWLLLSRWVNLDTGKKRQLNQLFALNRRVMQAYHAQGKLEPALYLFSRRCDGALREELDRSVAMAAAGAV